MILKKWEDLPEDMQIPEVRKYYDILARRKCSLILKRGFDIIVSFIMLLVLAIPMLIISIMIVIDSPGGIFYRQERVTTYGKIFRIHKFRTMVANADKIGSLVTVGKDNRITKIGGFLRKYRLDEFPQLIDVLQGNRNIIETTKVKPYFMGFASA